MRIFGDSFELMSEMGRELRSYGITVKPKHYQNKDIEGNEDYITKEIIDKICSKTLNAKIFDVLNKIVKMRYTHIKFSFFPTRNTEISFLKIKIKRKTIIPNKKNGIKVI